MSLNIASLANKLSSIAPSAPESTGTTQGAGSLFQSTDSPFKDVLSSAINEVEGSRADANSSVQKFLAGDGDDLHSTILATQRADLEFQMFLQVRNKVVSAYQEVMKMPM